MNKNLISIINHTNRNIKSYDNENHHHRYLTTCKTLNKWTDEQKNDDEWENEDDEIDEINEINEVDEVDENWKKKKK